MRGNVGNTGYWSDGDIQDHRAVDVISLFAVVDVGIDVVVVDFLVVGRVEDGDGGCVVFNISLEQWNFAWAILSPNNFIVSAPKQFSKNWSLIYFSMFVFSSEWLCQGFMWIQKKKLIQNCVSTKLIKFITIDFPEVILETAVQISDGSNVLIPDIMMSSDASSKRGMKP